MGVVHRINKAVQKLWSCADFVL